MVKKSVLFASAGLMVVGALAVISPAHADSPTSNGQAAATTPNSTEVGAVVVTGVRGRPRTLTTSPVEIDIINAKQLTTT